MEDVKSRGIFFFNDTATTEIYTLSLHDALPICCFVSARTCASHVAGVNDTGTLVPSSPAPSSAGRRSEEHTSELQSRQYLVCRLLLEKKTTRPRLFSVPLHLRRKPDRDHLTLAR